MQPRVDVQLNDLLVQAVRTLTASQSFDGLRWEVPKDSAFGDLSSPVGFRLASQQRQAPQQIAQRLIDVLEQSLRQSPLRSAVDRFEVKQGFVNLFLSHRALLDILSRINQEGGAYGASRLGQGRKVDIEFVSANPTGPLSVAHGRQAAVGDALARVMRSQGYAVTTEYYLNDEGRQIELLGRSLRARYLQALGQDAPFPDDGYHGQYVTEYATRLAETKGQSLAREPEAAFIKLGMDEMLRRIKDDLGRFGLTFDEWSSQAALRASGRVDAALEALKTRGVLYEADGAMWFASTKFGDDKDRVVRKQSGELTYLAPDIAYHEWKFTRGYEQVINLWGPDHHGYIARVKAAVTALGLPAERLVVRIVQLVTLSRHGKVVPMSKRQGEFVTFREVLDEAGVDATRFFYLMRTMESHLDFDLDLATSQSQENPVYYVQYAHARICSILANAKQEGPQFEPAAAADELARLVEPEERLLLRQLFQFPMVLAMCAQALEPHGVTVYLQRLAECFHVLYTKHRVIGEDAALSRARLALIRATRGVIANGLGVLGVSAPARMEQQKKGDEGS